MTFPLDPRLEADTFFAADLALCTVRVMGDARYPWLVAVPRVVGAVELFDLSEAQGRQLWSEMQALGHLVAAQPGITKVNIGALGNIVRQLHIHIVGRHNADPAWPGPVWGHSPAQPYQGGAADGLIDQVRMLADRLEDKF
jgi:diadenosine tetraphosphate (Ap4A) HIT family hydrolase